MNILVTGASGFVGSHIVNDLLKAGHQVVCCVRNVEYTKKLFPQLTIIKCDFVSDIDSAAWLTRLNQIDIVINTVGIFYHPIKKIIWRTHYEVPRALFDACVKAKVKKIIHVSALNVDQYAVDYAKSKLAADEYLLSFPIVSVILRPSFIYGRGSYGGTSLFRGLAGLPGILPLPNGGKQLFQPIYLPDFCTIVTRMVEKPLNESIILNTVCEEKITLKDIILTLKQWLALPKAMVLSIPNFFMRLAGCWGNLQPHSVINTDAVEMLSKNNLSSKVEREKCINTTKFIPRNFKEGVFAETSSVQDRWHAQLYFVKPLLQFSLAFVWIFTAICSLGLYPIAGSYELLRAVGVNAYWQPILLYSAALIDLLIGLCLLFNIQVRKICILQFLIIFSYTLIITFKLPLFWLHPFGPITKNFPFLIAIYILYILENNK